MAMRVLLGVAASAGAAAGAASPRPNVLFIVSDDLRPELGVYGGKAITRNVDKLAKSPGAVLFERSYVQQAICCPTRSSFLTGRRPDTTKVWDLHTHFRASGGDFITLPQYFLQNGYYTMGMGKVFHPVKDPATGLIDDVGYTSSRSLSFSLSFSAFAPLRRCAVAPLCLSALSVSLCHI